MFGVLVLPMTSRKHIDDVHEFAVLTRSRVSETVVFAKARTYHYGSRREIAISEMGRDKITTTFTGPL